MWENTMCGIAGLISPKRSTRSHSASETLLRLLSHRGPDDYGWLLSSPHDFRLGRGIPPPFEADAILWHRRLSILDLSRGRLAADGNRRWPLLHRLQRRDL